MAFGTVSIIYKNNTNTLHSSDSALKSGSNRKSFTCVHRCMSQVKKNAQPKVKFSLGTLLRTVVWDSLSDSSEELLWRGRRGARIYMNFRGWGIHVVNLGKRLLLITKNRPLKLMILLLFYGMMQESGLIEIIPQVCILSRANIQSTECFLVFFFFSFFLYSSQGTPSGDCLQWLMAWW